MNNYFFAYFCESEIVSGTICGNIHYAVGLKEARLKRCIARMSPGILGPSVQLDQRGSTRNKRSNTRGESSSIQASHPSTQRERTLASHISRPQMSPRDRELNDQKARSISTT